MNSSHSVNMSQQDYAYTSLYNMNVNVQDWLFQSEIVYDGLNSQNVTVSGGRIVTDFFEQQIRVTLGDNNPQTRIWF